MTGNRLGSIDRDDAFRRPRAMLISGTLNGWEWFGHSGGLQGYITRTCVIPEHDLTLSVMTNATAGRVGLWVDGASFLGPGLERLALRWTAQWMNP